MRRTFILLILLQIVLNLYSIPAKRTWMVVKQSDGSVLTLMNCGDERYHYFVTTDGFTVLQNSNDNNYYYANKLGFSETVSSILAHDPENRSETETEFLSALRSLESSAATAKPISRKSSSKQTSTEPRYSFTGVKRGLIILTQFSDVKFSEPDPRLTFDSIANYRGYTKGNFVGSVNDYFYAQSSGMFDINFDVVGPITLSKPESYYGTNTDDGIDSYSGEMVAEACLAVDDSVDFKNYEWNSDGVVNQVYILYAGYGENENASLTTIYPHEWTLFDSDYGKSLVLDGSTINTYACSNELSGDGSSRTKKICGIGTMCHEFSHCLGLPDMYDTTNSGVYGMDCWDILDYGSYNGDGYQPAGYTSYEKWWCGWLDPVELVNNQNMDNVAALSDGGQSYVIYNDNDRNEYYLLENRQLINWDASLPGVGLLVTHVDYSEQVWSENILNVNYFHPRMTVIPADNLRTINSVAHDAYPYNTNDSLTTTSIPSTKIYNINTDGSYYMKKAITNITQNNDGTMSFWFRNDLIATSIDNVLSLEDFLNNPATIYDAHGRVICTTACFTGKEDIPSGVYIVKNKKGKSHKFIYK
jgi:immune inhibitor A